MTSDHPRFVLVPGDSPVSLPRTMSLRRDGPWGEGRRDAGTSEITGTGRGMGTGGEPRPRGSACWPSQRRGRASSTLSVLAHGEVSGCGQRSNGSLPRSLPSRAQTHARTQIQVETYQIPVVHTCTHTYTRHTCGLQKQR